MTDVSALGTDGVRAPVLASKSVWVPEAGLAVGVAGGPALQTGVVCQLRLLGRVSDFPVPGGKSSPHATRCLLVRPAAEAVSAASEPRLSCTHSDVYNLVSKNFKFVTRRSN